MPASPRKPLTARLVEAVLASPERRDHADTQVVGLTLRGTQTGATWVVRWRKTGAKITLGRPPEVSLKLAREMARSTIDRLRAGLVPDGRFLEALRIKHGLQEERAVVPVAPRIRPRTWLYEEAVAEYLEENASRLRPATIKSYGYVLTHPEVLGRFKGVGVCDITEENVARLIEDVGRRSGSMAEAMVRILKGLWKWMSAPTRREKSGVTSHVIRDVSAPPRSRGDKAGRTVRRPNLSTVAELVAYARHGLGNLRVRQAIELTVLTVQRRETVVSAAISDINLDPFEPVWDIDGLRMKGGDAHALPLSPRAAAVFAAAIEEAKALGSEFVFPGVRPRKVGKPVTHLHASVMTHEVGDVSGTTSPHRMRLAFGSTIVDLGYDERDVAMVLDHREGRQSVTARHYVRSDRLDRKRAILEAWEQALEAPIAEAVRTFDPVATMERLRAARKSRQKGKRKRVPEQVAEHGQKARSARRAEADAMAEDRRIVEETLRGLGDKTLSMVEVRRRLRLPEDA